MNFLGLGCVSFMKKLYLCGINNISAYELSIDI